MYFHAQRFDATAHGLSRYLLEKRQATRFAQAVQRQLDRIRGILYALAVPSRYAADGAEYFHVVATYLISNGAFKKQGFSSFW